VDQLTLRAAALPLLLVTLLVPGCTPQSARTPAPAVSTPVATSAPSPAPSEPAELVAEAPGDEPVIFAVASRHGGYLAGPFPRTSDRINVYVRCFGEGALDVDLTDVATFAVDCETDSAGGTLNSFDVRYADEFTVKVGADDSQLWAMTITEVPL
jgi:hypothetical protein